MICLGTLQLPLYVCPYTIPANFQNQNFDGKSNDPVMYYDLDSNANTGTPFYIFAPSPFDYGINQSTNVKCGGVGASYACLNGTFVGNTGQAFSGSGTGYAYTYFTAPYVQTGGVEGLSIVSPMTIGQANFSGFTGAFGGYGFVNPQCFPLPTIIKNSMGIVSEYNYCNLTGPGTGYSSACVISTPQGNMIAPQNNSFCYLQSFNFQLVAITAKFNTIMGLFPNNGQWTRMDWSSFSLLNVYTTPINIPVTGMFTPLTIDDNNALNLAFNNTNAGANDDPNQIMSNDYFFTAVIKNVSSFSNMASTVLMMFPDRGYYINVQLIGKTSAAVSALSNEGYSIQYDRRGWFMFVNPSVSQSAIFNTVPLTVDFTFPPLPKNAINPLPCFNNAIEGLIVG